LSLNSAFFSISHTCLIAAPEQLHFVEAPFADLGLLPLQILPRHFERSPLPAHWPWLEPDFANDLLMVPNAFQDFLPWHIPHVIMVILVVHLITAN
jgi:hypothetical protein